MPTLSVAELAEATGGELARGTPTERVDTFVMDSRRIGSSSVFFALRGTRTDGHRFLEQAAAAGAVAAVVESLPPPGQPAPRNLVLVADTPAAMVRAATWVRRRASGVRWIALTGSNGKTTTKEMIAAGLGVARRVHRTPGNFNNHLGVPLTLLALPDDAQDAVVELAMSGPGEIDELTRIVDPDIGLVTNVRPVHMAFFRTVDDVAAAKGELYARLRDDAVSVVNLDDPHVRVQATRHTGRRVTFGRHAEADLHVEHVENRYLPGASLALRYRGQSLRLDLRIGGAHAAFDAAAALATLAAAGEPLEPAAQAIERLEAGAGRGRVHRLERQLVVVDDTYNSSPPALASVLEALRATPTDGRKVLVMGDMLELGPMEGALHREAGKRAAAAGVQLLVTVGPLAREAAETARRAGVPEVHHHPDSARAADFLRGALRSGDLVVVKGSRGVRMELVVEALVGARREAG